MHCVTVYLHDTRTIHDLSAYVCVCVCACVYVYPFEGIQLAQLNNNNILPTLLRKISLVVFICAPYLHIYFTCVCVYVCVCYRSRRNWLGAQLRETSRHGADHDLQHQTQRIAAQINNVRQNYGNTSII